MLILKVSSGKFTKWLDQSCNHLFIYVSNCISHDIFRKWITTMLFVNTQAWGTVWIPLGHIQLVVNNNKTETHQWKQMTFCESCLICCFWNVMVLKCFLFDSTSGNMFVIMTQYDDWLIIQRWKHAIYCWHFKWY